MVRVADKIRKAEPLTPRDLKVWTRYNFMVFPTEEQEKLRALMERQDSFWRKLNPLLPLLFFGVYAIGKYQFGLKVLPNLAFSGFTLYAMTRLGLYSSEREMKELNSRLYDEYKDEVLNPRYRGLKLTAGKKMYQVDNREFTTSNFDDLKELIKKNR